MGILTSNLPPVNTKNKSFKQVFEELFFSCDCLRIAVGYISVDSITEIKKAIELNNRPNLELFIGMHKFSGFTKVQHKAVLALNDFLIRQKYGKVLISSSFKYHGKVYEFSSNRNVSKYIFGSSNLDSISENNHIYETDYLVTNIVESRRIREFLDLLFQQAGRDFSEYKPETFIANNNFFQNHEYVSKVDQGTLANLFSQKHAKVFKLPVKSTPKSNLNVFFGEGRKNQMGIIKPRPWYEVELIVPKSITSHKAYPSIEKGHKIKIIKVFTDDGWSFECTISGDFSKNFRSSKDLTILGKWLKGRLEEAGALEPGEPVTEAVLTDYGKDHVEMLSTQKKDTWLLNFQK